MNSKKPINLDLKTIKFSITAYISILHRMSGIIIFFSMIVILFVLQISLESEKSFNTLNEYLNIHLIKLLILLFLSVLIYHLIAGIRHLMMDIGIIDSVYSGNLSSKLVLFIVFVFMIIIGIRMW